MDAELYHRLNYQLKLLEADHAIFSERFSHCKQYVDYRLKRNPRKRGRVYYYVRKPGDKDYHYKGKEDHPLVKAVREAHQLNAILSRLEQDIELVRALLKGYAPYDFATVAATLREAYKIRVMPQPPKYLEVAAKWKKEKLAYKATFPENYPDNNQERTADGTMVKTISEVVVYNRLLDAGLIPVYELPLPSREYGKPSYPDFSVLSPIDLKTTIIIEYVGRLDLKEYRESFAYRLIQYMKNGYKPGVNLFFVFGDERGHIDSMQLNRIIADIKGL